MSVPQTDPPARSRPVLFYGAFALFAGVFLLYSQTLALAWDEGYHMITAWMIRSGKQPYLDFVFPQTPLNAYWNAFWMWLCGERWRVVHALAALEACGSVLLAAAFVRRRLPIPGWRVPCAAAIVAFAGWNDLVFEFGPVGQAYGMCLLLLAAAFFVAPRSVERPGPWWSGASGLFAGAAAGSSLLSAAAGPVLLVWILLCNRAGKRWPKAAAFVGGVIVAFLPVIWLFAKSPKLVFFNLIEYQLIYRTVNWAGATQHNLEVLSSWINSPQALVLGILAVVGLVHIARSDWDRPVRQEFYLAAWMAAALFIHISIAHPTFRQYYCLATPFLAILAAVGLYTVTKRLGFGAQPARAVVAVTALFCLAEARMIYDDRESFNWMNLEEVARKVDQVTPPGAPLLADEQIYFLTHRPPPSGYGLKDSHKLGMLPPELTAALHVVPQAEVERLIKAGHFSTAENCDDDDDQDRKLGLPEVYANEATIHTCHIYWNRK